MKLLKTLIVTVLLVAGAMTFTGCNTARGLGQDMENAGESIQDGAQ